MKKILLLTIIFFWLIWNTFADNISYNYPILWDVENKKYSMSVLESNYINNDTNSVNEFCFSKWYNYISHIDWLKASWENAMYDTNTSTWILSTSTSNFAKRIICDDWLIFSNSWSVLNKTIISWEQTIKLEWEIKNSDNTFMKQNELYNFYVLELTILLFFALIISIRKLSVHDKKDEFKF